MIYGPFPTPSSRRPPPVSHFLAFSSGTPYLIFLLSGVLPCSCRVQKLARSAPPSQIHLLSIWILSRYLLDSLGIASIFHTFSGRCPDVFKTLSRVPTCSRRSPNCIALSSLLHRDISFTIYPSSEHHFLLISLISTLDRPLILVTSLLLEYTSRLR